jgi:hypothetical protein
MMGRREGYAWPRYRIVQGGCKKIQEARLVRAFLYCVSTICEFGAANGQLGKDYRLSALHDTDVAESASIFGQKDARTRRA